MEQTVDAAGSLVVALRSCEADRTEEEGDALLAELAGRAFDTAGEWPLRIGLVERDGTAHYVAFALSHTAADGWGLRRVVTDLLALAGGDSPAAVAARFAAAQPLEEAAFQASARGQRQDAAARRYWRKKLLVGPGRVFPAPQEPLGELRFPNAVLNSPALARAVQLVAAQHRAGSASVLLAAASAMMTRLSGASEVMLQVVVNNRFLPGLTNSVSTVAQEGLFHLPDADREFAEVIGRTQATSLATYRNAYFDSRLLDRDITELVADGGAPADRSCVFNDTRVLIPEQPDPSRSSKPLKEARSLTTLSWPVEFEPRPNLSFAMDAVQAPGSLELSMTADSRIIPRAEMERFLCGIEELVVGEALAAGAD